MTGFDRILNAYAQLEAHTIAHGPVNKTETLSACARARTFIQTVQANQQGLTERVRTEFFSSWNEAVTGIAKYLTTTKSVIA